MKNSWFGIRIAILLIVMAIAGFYQILSIAGVDLDTAISNIALILFIGMMAYYLLPKPQGRRHRNVTSMHKQYNDSRLTDFMMEKIMKAYNIKEESGDASEESNGGDVLDKSASSEIDRRQFEESSSAKIEKVIDRESGGKVENETEDESNTKFNRKKYNDSLLSDYMMGKIMKAYNVPEEAESEAEGGESEFEENDDSSPTWVGQQPQFDSYEMEDVEARSKSFDMISTILEIIGFLWLCGIIFAEANLPSAKTILEDKTLFALIIKVFPVLLFIAAIIARILSSRDTSSGNRAFAIFRGIFLLLVGIGYIINQLSDFLPNSK